MCGGMWGKRRTQQKANAQCAFAFAVIAGSNVKIISGDYVANGVGLPWLCSRTKGRIIVVSKKGQGTSSKNK